MRATRLTVDGVQARAGIDFVNAAVEFVRSVLSDLIDDGSAGSSKLCAGIVQERGYAGEEVWHDGLD